MTKIKPVFNLTPEELEIEAEFKRGDLESVPVSFDRLQELQAIARNTLAKNKAITIRVSERNLMRLKAAAAREGIPYQTFITSLIQKNT
ncbi:antitoxin [Candidatus Kaiserbacteria bacterium]|nr:antitoxin [Candidatus Kaiserbacteria bacterium]